MPGMEYEDVLMRNQELMIIINRLTAEVCELKSHNFAHKITPKGYAELRKWDCFKEDGNV